jgi:hypothetical protein
MNPLRDLGPCSVIFDSVDLGATQGGVTFRHTESGKTVNEDQHGVTPVDEIKTGATCSVEVPLTRTSLGQLAKVVGASSYTGTRLRVKNATGISLLDNAKVLILKPIVNGVTSTDSSNWLTIQKAYAKADFEVSYGNENQRIYKVVFTAFPDANNELWRIGA